MRLVRVISMLFLAAALSPSALRGQGTLYWDTNGPVAGSGNAGGNWWGNDWSTSSQGTLATQSWTNGASAVFSAGSDGVGAWSVNVNQSGTRVHNLTVNQGNVTLTGQGLQLVGSADTWFTGAGSLTASNGTLDLNGAALTVEASQPMNLGAIAIINSGSAATAGLVKTNHGTLILSGSNNYSGSGGGSFATAAFNSPTVHVTNNVSAGIVQAASSGTFLGVPNSTNITTLSGNAELDLNGYNETVGLLSEPWHNYVTQAYGITTSRAGTVTLTICTSDAQTLGPYTNFDGNISDGAGKMNVTYEGYSNWNYGWTGLQLSGQNTFTGTLTIASGFIWESGSPLLDSNGNVVSSNVGKNAALVMTGVMVPSASNAAYLDTQGVLTTYLGSISGTGYIRNLSAGYSTSTLIVGGNNTSTTFAGQIGQQPQYGDNANLISLTKVGSGTLTLTGTNLYAYGNPAYGGLAGVTVFAGGVLNAGSPQPFGTYNAPGAMLFNGGILQYSAANQLDYSGRFSTTGGQLWQVDPNGQNITYATPLLGSGSSLTLTGSNGGSLTLAANESYDGGTFVTGGTLTAGLPNALPGSGAVTVSDGVLDASAYPQQVASLDMTGPATLILSVGNLLASSGSADLAGTLNVLDFSGGSAELMSYSSESGTFGAATGFNPSLYHLAYGTNQLDIVPTGSGPGLATSVPEPGTLVLLAAGSAALWLRSKSQRAREKSKRGFKSAAAYLICPVVLLVGAALSPGIVRAQSTLYWDTKSGGDWWDANWSTDPTGASPPGAWIQYNNAFFSAGSDGTGNLAIDVNQAGTIVRSITVAQGNITLTGQGFALASASTWSTATGTTLTASNSTIVNSNNNLTLSPAASSTIDLSRVAVTGSGTAGDDFAVNGNGTVLLSGSNTYGNGGQVINLASGTVKIASPMPAGPTYSTIYSGGVVTAALPYGPFGASSADESLTISSAASLDLNGFNTTIPMPYGTGGIVTNNAAGTSATVTINQANLTVPMLDVASNIAFDNGAGTLSVVYAGPFQGLRYLDYNINSSNPPLLSEARFYGVQLGGASTISGTFTIASGHVASAFTSNGVAGAFGAPDVNVVLSNSGAWLENVGDGTSTPWNASDLDTNGYYNIIGSLSGNGCVDNLKLSDGLPVIGTLVIGGTTGCYNNTSTTFSGEIISYNNIIKTGSGTLTLTGINTYYTTTDYNGDTNVGGITTLAGGVLNAGSPQPFGARTAPGSLLFTGGILQYSAANQVDYSGRFANTGGQVWQIDPNGQNVTYATPLEGTGSSLTLTGTNGGSLTLAAAASYDSGTTVSGGTLIVGVVNALPATGSVLVNGGVLSLLTQSTSAGAVTLAGGAITGTTGVLYGTSYDVQNGSVTAILGGANATLTKDGSGIATLSGANAYGGGTQILSGVLSVATTSSLPGWNTPFTYSIAAGATLAVGDGVSDASIASLLATGYFFPSASLGFDTTNGSRTYSGVLTDSGNGPLGVTKVGANTLVLAGSNSYSGNTTIIAGALEAVDGVGLAAGSNLVFSGNLAETGYGAVFQSNGAFSRTLGTLAGEVQWAGDGGFAASGGPLTVSISPGVPLKWGSTAYFLASGAVLTFGSNTANSQVDFTDSIDLYGGNRQIEAASGEGGDSALISGNLIDTLGGASLAKTGPGVLILSGTDTYSGGTYVDGGTLVATTAAAIPAGASLTVGAAGELIFDPTADAAPQAGVATAPTEEGAALVPEPGTAVLLAACVAAWGILRSRSRTSVFPARRPVDAAGWKT